MVIALFVLTIVTLGPSLGVLQGRFFPVTSRVVLFDIRYDENVGRTYFKMEFEKYYNCDLRGVTFRRLGVSVVAGPAEPTISGTVTTGKRKSGEWLVAGSPPLDDVTIEWSHNCHPLWTVLTDATPLPDPDNQAYGATL